LAELSYLPQLEIEKGLAQAGYSGVDVLFFKHSLFTGFILRWDEVTAIAIKGTSNWRELLSNLNVWPEPTDHGRVHAGYLYTIKRFGPALFTLIMPDLEKGSKILIPQHYT
jgi:hypothetical protein